MSEEDDDFLARWSRRKKESRQGLRKAEDGDSSEAHSDAQTAALSEDPLPESEETEARSSETPDPAEETPTEELTEEDFADVDFDALNYESDYGRFMKEGVPESIRRRALKQLYRSNPILANVDGLNDYDDDFTDAALAVEVLQTAYKVGRGYLTDEDIAKLEDDDDDEAELEAEVAEVESDEPESEEETGERQASVDGEAAIVDETDDNSVRES